MSSQFIGREDWEGDNSNSVAMEDDDNDNTDAEAGEYVCDFLRSRYTNFERGILGGRHR